MIWAATQHYADFEIQVRPVLSLKVGDTTHFWGGGTDAGAPLPEGRHRRQQVILALGYRKAGAVSPAPAG
jgi:YcdC-like protein, C-terminal region